MNKNHTVIYTVPMEYAELAEDILITHTDSGFEEKILSSGESVFAIYAVCDEKNTIWHADITSLLQEQCKAKVEYIIGDVVEWIEEWKKVCVPVHAGSFYIVPEWFEGEIPNDVQVLRITPKMAFGTGHHATTALCLEAISYPFHPSILKGTFADIGTGSGILSIALAKRGMRGKAIDIDPIAIENTLENIALNADSTFLDNAIFASVGDIYSLPKEEKYSLLVANILAEPLHAIAEPVAERMEKGGICILSGVLGIQVDSLVERYTALGFTVNAIRHQGEWAMVMVCYT